MPAKPEYQRRRYLATALYAQVVASSLYATPIAVAPDGVYRWKPVPVKGADGGTTSPQYRFQKIELHWDKLIEIKTYGWMEAAAYLCEYIWP